VAVIDKLKPGVKGPAVPKDIHDRLKRGREVMLQDASKRRLYTRFERGEQYWYVNEKGVLNFQATVTTASGGKPPHRIRNKYNFIRAIVEGKISAATQRVPSYEITPSTTEPDDAAAARLAEKVALYGYDKWMVRRATVKAVKLALVQGEGFVMPVFDPNVGPFIEEHDEETGKTERIGQGEIRLLVFDGNQVFWQPGCDFYESRWWAIERAMPVEEAEQIPGFVGGKLAADATTAEVPTDRRDSDDFVLVTEYLERPCPKYPDGRRLMIANGRVIAPPESYPCRDAKGRVVDEPVIHRLSYVVDPSADRDQGLVEQLVDLQRTINDCWNKLLEWKNRALNPRLLAPKGSLTRGPNDAPGGVDYYNPVGGMKPEWQPTPAIPRELFEILQQAIEHMRAIAADVDVQAEADLAARTAQAAIEQSRARWQSFIGDLAEFHSRVMRHCLTLVQGHYTEPRLVKIQGLFGPELVPGFMGADLRGQADVRVLSSSIEVKSRKSVVEETLLFADRQWISPQAAMATIKGGVAESLGRAFELDVARANQIIQMVKEGPDKLFSIPTRAEADPVTGAPTQIPGWLPRRHIDNTDIWIQVWSMWMKTSDFFRLEPGLQEAANLVFESLMMHQQQEQAAALAAQNAQAEQQGMANAAMEQRAKPSPDQRMPDMPDTQS
jgi:hypothetical protein